MMALPAKYASKVGLYDVIVHNALVKVRVVENPDVISLGLSELESEIGESKLVGIMVKKEKFNAMIVLCVKSRCLIIQMCRIKIIPKCLKDFFSDTGICFVGPSMEVTLHWLRVSEHTVWMGSDYYLITCSIDFSGMDVGDLAAKVLQDPTLLTKNWIGSKPIAEHLQSIADKAGVALQRDSGHRANEKDPSDRADKLASIDLSALAFSPEEIKLLVADVYASYLIAAKLLDSL